MKVTGVIVAGESASAMAYIKRRRGLSPRQMRIILLICMVAVGVPVGTLAWGAWNSEAIIAALITVEFSFVGLFLGVFLIGRLTGPSMRKALTKRGQAYEQPLAFELTPANLVYGMADLIMTAGWPCVTDLYRTRKYWVFLVQSSAMVLPRRFFATHKDERDFIAEAMSHMTDAALARSPDAARFVDGQHYAANGN